jgi:polyisoprenoid-binding protein YceI
MKKWSIDPDHSAARFSVRHFMIANVEGLFSQLKGEIQFDPADPSHLSVECEIDVNTLTTGLSERDNHLLSPDYFDAGKYPKMVFRGARVEPSGDNRGKITGELTLRGIQRPVTLDFEFFGPVKSPFSGITCMGFSASGVINREDYGMTWNAAMEGNGVVTAREVRIHIEVEADLITA